MAVDQQADQPVATAVPIGLERQEQLGHLAFGQMLADAVSVIGLATSSRNWSHNRSFDQLEVRRFHWLYPPV